MQDLHAVLVNLRRRPDRLAASTAVLTRHGIRFSVFNAVDGKAVIKSRGHGLAQQYACQLSHRLIIRAGMIDRLPGLLIFEDDLMLRDGFDEAFSRMAPPPDWDIILLGCTHVKSPIVVASGWVRVRGFWGTHAYLVRQQAYKVLLRELRKPLDPDIEAGIDNVISRLSDRIRIYSVYPNLAWQRGSLSDYTGTYREMFDEQGIQKRFPRIIEKIEEEMVKFPKNQANVAP